MEKSGGVICAPAAAQGMVSRDWGAPAKGHVQARVKV